MSDDRHKPRGTSGHVRVDVSENGRPNKSFVADVVGHSKAQIEQTIVDQFCVAMRRNGATILSAKPKSENDFDFELQLHGGTIDLELTELVPPAPGGGTPFRRGHYSSTMGDEEARLLKAIYKKDDRYSKKSKVPIHLIVYPTDFSARVFPEVLSLVRIALAERPPRVIENIFWVHISEIEDLQLSCLYPFDVSIYPLEKRAYVRSVPFTLFDPILSELSYNIEGVGTSEDDDVKG